MAGVVLVLLQCSRVAGSGGDSPWAASLFLVGDMDNGPLKDNTLCHPQTLLLPLGEEHKSFAVSARCYWLNHVGW